MIMKRLCTGSKVNASILIAHVLPFVYYVIMRKLEKLTMLIAGKNIFFYTRTIGPLNPPPLLKTRMTFKIILSLKTKKKKYYK